MISIKTAPVAWAMLMYDLEDARDDLDSIVSGMMTDPDFDETEFKIRLGHVYWHLNRAWRRRNAGDELVGIDIDRQGQFPDDLQPE